MSATSISAEAPSSGLHLTIARPQTAVRLRRCRPGENIPSRAIALPSVAIAAASKKTFDSVLLSFAVVLRPSPVALASGHLLVAVGCRVRLVGGGGGDHHRRPIVSGSSSSAAELVVVGPCVVGRSRLSSLSKDLKRDAAVSEETLGVYKAALLHRARFNLKI